VIILTFLRLSGVFVWKAWVL